jgi:LL-diaminopimelate aminotransferase
VVPKDVKIWDKSGHAHSLHGFWNRRHTTKFNGVSFPVQKAAAAAYSPEGQEQIRILIDGYLDNAAIIRREMDTLGFDFVGGENSPYIWIDSRRDAWSFFDLLLNQAGVVCTPGPGFGRCGDGYIRISAFNSRDNVRRAMERIREALN